MYDICMYVCMHDVRMYKVWLKFLQIALSRMGIDRLSSLLCFHGDRFRRYLIKNIIMIKLNDLRPIFIGLAMSFQYWA